MVIFSMAKTVFLLIILKFSITVIVVLVRKHTQYTITNAQTTKNVYIARNRLYVYIAGNRIRERKHYSLRLLCQRVVKIVTNRF